MSVNVNSTELLEPILSATFMNSVYLKQLNPSNSDKNLAELIAEVVDEWVKVSSIVRQSLQASMDHVM